MSGADIWDLEYRFGAWLRFQGVRSGLGATGVLVPGPKAEIKPRRTHGAQAEGHGGAARRAARAERATDAQRGDRGAPHAPTLAHEHLSGVGPE